MATLLSNGAYGCIFKPQLNCETGMVSQSKHNQNVVSKLQEDDYTAANEYRIGQKIRAAIPDFSRYFLPVHDKCSVNVNSTNSYIRECEITKGSVDNYALLKMPYIDGISVSTFLTETPMSDGAERFTLFIDSYQRLLDAIELLATENIVHNDLHTENIFTNKETKLPLLIDFGLSIDTTRLDDKNVRAETFFAFEPSVEHWCIDVHILCQIQQHKYVSNFTDDYVSSESYLTTILFPEEIDQYKAKCNEVFAVYEGQQPEVLFQNLTEASNTWDNFALSVAFLKIIDRFNIDNIRDNPFFEQFVQLLRVNIDPDPLNRYSLASTRANFDALLEDTESFRNAVELFRERA